ncbi:hypothetical protein [Mycoplasma sp. Z244C]
MKKTHWILLTLGGITTSLVPLFATQCSKQQEDAKKPEPDKNVVVTPVKKVKTVELAATKVTELNALAKTLKEADQEFKNDATFTDIKLHYNIQLGGKFNLNKNIEYTKDEWNSLIQKLNSKKINTNVELGTLLIEINSQNDLTNAEKALEDAYHNYYVNEDWFTNRIKTMLKNAGGNLLGSVTLENAVKKGKQEEYNALVNEIKAFMTTNGNVKLADDLEISKIDQDLNKGWSLTITLKKDNLVAKGIKLNFRKPHSDWSDAEILAKNNEDSRFDKVKATVAEKALDYKMLIAGLSKDGNEVLKTTANSLIEVVVLTSLKTMLPVPLNIICSNIMSKPMIKYLNNLADQLIEVYYPKTKLS